jgi:hypothetical protein
MIKKIVLIYLLLESALLAFPPMGYHKYVSIGMGVTQSDSYSGGLDFISTDIGIKSEYDKIYINMNNINYDEDNDIGAFSYTINYDKFIYNEYNKKIYIGSGIGMVEIGNDDKIFARRLYLNLKSGIIYDFTMHWSINAGLNYWFTNYPGFRNTFGFLTSLEYQF